MRRVLPSVILDRQRAFGLDAIDMNILMHLAKHWWYSEKVPHPSKKAIADCMKIDISTVRRRIAQMEKDGLVKRVPRFDPKYRGQKTNEYRFDGLIEKAKPYAEEIIEGRKQQNKESAARRTRMRLLKRPEKSEE